MRLDYSSTVEWGTTGHASGVVYPEWQGLYLLQLFTRDGPCPVVVASRNGRPEPRVEHAHHRDDGDGEDHDGHHNLHQRVAGLVSYPINQ